MLNRMKVFAIVVLAVAGIAAAPSAKADPEESLRMTFQSGATFSGLWVVVTPGSLATEGDPVCAPRADETGAGVWVNATEQERRRAEKQAVKRGMC